MANTTSRQDTTMRLPINQYWVRNGFDASYDKLNLPLLKPQSVYDPLEKAPFNLIVNVAHVQFQHHKTPLLADAGAHSMESLINSQDVICDVSPRNKSTMIRRDNEYEDFLESIS